MPWRQALDTEATASADVRLAMPKALGGAGNNPEQLFAAGCSACLLGAMTFAASRGDPQVPAATTVAAEVGIGPRAEGSGSA